MSLIAAELEKRDISTVVIQLLREVAEKVQPPRALFVPFRHGFPLAAPNDSRQQHAVIEAALRLLEDDSARPPMLREFRPEGGEISEP